MSLSEAEAHWREFLASLQARGLHGVRIITSDDHAGLTEALAARLQGVPWQRCQFHFAENLLDHLPSNLSQEVASAELRGVFDAPDRSEAERLLGRMVDKYATSAPRLAAWLEANVPEDLTVFALLSKLRHRLRTNSLGMSWFQHYHSPKVRRPFQPPVHNS